METGPEEIPGDSDEGESVLLDIDGVPSAAVRPDKVYDYYATVPGGLEHLAQKDIRYHLKGLSKLRIDREGGRQGRLFFRYTRSPRRLLELRSVERVFALVAIIGKITVGRPGLVRLAERVLEADLAPAVTLHDILHGPKDEVRFNLDCTVGGDHRFSSSEVHQIVQTVLEAKYEVYPEEYQAPYRLHLQVLGRRAVFGLELAGPTQEERRGEVPRSAAHCLGLMAKVAERDVCFDPYPGDGSMLKAIAGSFSPRRAIEGNGDGVEDGSVDRVVTIPPTREVAGREPTLIAELGRVLKPRRIAAVVVEDRQALENAAREAGFEVMQTTPMRLRGRPLAAVVVRKRG